MRTILLGLVVGICIMSVTSGCHNSGSDAAKSAPDSAVKDETPGADEGLHLKPEEVTKLGVSSEPAKSVTHAPEALGFGVVIGHETIAQSLADLRTAAAVARQSQSALARVQRLSGTPGAMPLDTVETAERQATVDAAALDLARQRLSSVFGQQAPWNGKDNSLTLTSLASGESKLVRVTFPMSSLTEDVPATIRLGRIGVGQTAKSWDSGTVWRAPADATVPGRSFFTIFKGNIFGEGERLIAWTPVAGPNDGVLIPSTAAVISAGKYWCYVEEKPGIYVRTEFDPSIPVSGGYFVTSGIDAGDKVVVMAAGQLLARELNPSTEAE